jgi:hypothetical protein
MNKELKTRMLLFKRRLDYQWRKLDWFERLLINMYRIIFGIGKYKTGYKQMFKELEGVDN